MAANAALGGAAPGSTPPAIRDREPPAWLRAQKLTPARARELLTDLESPCPGEDADARTRHSDAQAKKFALLVFGMGAVNAPEVCDATPARSNAASPGGSKKEDAFAAAVASCASHPDRDVRVLAVDALVAIAERDPKAAAPHVGALVTLLRDPEDAPLALAALRRETFPRLCRAAAAAAATRTSPSFFSAAPPRRAAPSSHAHDAFDVLAAALAARGPDAFARNASALQLVDALGPETAWRHADAVAAFVAAAGGDVSVGGVSASVEDARRDATRDETVAAAEEDEEADKSESVSRGKRICLAEVPAHGFALCELALRALRGSPEAATRHVALARRWTAARSVPEPVRNAAAGLVRFADSRNAEIFREMRDMRGERARVEGAAVVLESEEDGRAENVAPKKTAAGVSAARRSPAFYDVRPDAT